MPISISPTRVYLDGVEFSGATQPDGCEYIHTTLSGWLGRPAPKTSRAERPRRAGSWPAPQWPEERVMTLEGHAWGPTRERREAAMTRLAALCSDPARLYELRVVTESSDLWTWVQIDDEITIDPQRNDVDALFQLGLVASDPVRYSTQEWSETVGQLSRGGDGLDWQSSGTGLDWSTGGGLDWGEPSSTGTLHISNDGTAPLWPVYEIRGPVANPRIIAATGRELVYGGTFGSADLLVIDSARRTVHLNGTPRRNLLLRAQWFAIPPGGLDITFRSDIPTSAATLTVRWRHAYW